MHNSGKRWGLMAAAAVLAGTAPVLAAESAVAGPVGDAPPVAYALERTKAVGTTDTPDGWTQYRLAALTYEATPGTKHEITATLDVDSADYRTRVSVMVACDGSSRTEPVGPQYVNTGQNILANTKNTIKARFIYTVPSDGAMTCSFWIRLSALDHQPGHTVRVLATSNIASNHGKLRWASDNSFLAGKVRLSPGQRRDVAINDFTVTTTRPVNVVGDVNLTDCYTLEKDSAGNVLCGTPDPQGDAKATTQLIVHQLPIVDGVPCHSAVSTARTTTVTKPVHHLKVHHSATISAKSGCSNVYKAYIRVTAANDSVNMVEIAPAHQTYTYAFIVEP